MQQSQSQSPAQTHKKKPRQRNRARNKANRLNTEENPGETINKNDINLEHVQQQQQHVVDEDSAGKSQQNNKAQLLNILSGPSTSSKPDEAIKVIQQVLRAKFLKQQQQLQQQQQKSETNTAVNVQRNICSPSKEKERKDAKRNEPAATKAKGKELADEKNTFMANLQKKMESVMANGRTDLPHSLLDNLQKLINQEPLDDIVSSDDEAEGEYIEYIYKPRQYFLVSLCNHCKCDLRDRILCECKRCHMTYYCSVEHMKLDIGHRQLCNALQQVADSSDGHIFYKCSDFTTEQFRMYRIVTIRKVEAVLERPLTATEQEVILFPRLCSDIRCREYRFAQLNDCKQCGQVAYCKGNAAHLNRHHQQWCRPYQLFKELVMFQEIYGRLEPSLPSAVLREMPTACGTTKEILHALNFDMHDECEYAALSQIATGPLTAWYALKLCNMLKDAAVLTIHLIGAEIEFEVDVLHKWELFFMHITPPTKQLNIVFVGPELNPRNISFEQLKKTKCCRECRKHERHVSYHFENGIYHDYTKLEHFVKPDLICFFNAGLYRCTGYNMADTWPATILAASQLRCPVVVTSYTGHEAPLDMTRFVQESNRRLDVVLPPTVNPFASEKPERNFISDEDAPLMFKNYYCFVVE